jgi:hypothetical protein
MPAEIYECKGCVLSMASHKIHCKHKVWSQHSVYWWSGIHEGQYCELSHYPFCFMILWVSTACYRASFTLHPPSPQVRMLGDQLLGPNRLTCAVLHAWWGTTSFSPHTHTVKWHPNQTSDEQLLGHKGPVNKLAWSAALNPLVTWLWGHLKTLVYSAPINDLEEFKQWEQNSSGESTETRNFQQCAPLYNEELKVALKRASAVEITWTVSISQQAVVSGNFCSFKWVLYPLKTCNPSF